MWLGINVSANLDAIDIQGPVYIGSSTSIEDGATLIGPTWIGNGCHIRKNAYVMRSIIFEYTRIGSGSTLKDSVAFGRYCVDRDGNVANEESMNLDWVSDARIPDKLD